MKRLLPLLVLAIALSSARAAVQGTDFEKKIVFTPSTTALAKIGETAWTGFPVLVRLPASVSSQLQAADGTDLYVEDENEVPLAFEVESFDPAGTTLVWVKVPSLSSATALTVYFRGSANADNDPTAVWTRYAGVWHFEPSAAGTTTVADATGHSLDGTTTGTISTYAGPFGGDTLQCTEKINAPDYDSLLSNVAQFSASGWFKAPNQSNAYFTYVSKKADLTWSADKGWYLEMSQSKTKANLVLTGSNNFNIPDVSANWNYFHLVSDGSTVKVYMNGSTSAAVSKSYTVKASSKVFLICGKGGCSDEYRVRAGAASAAETALEYATMADAAFFDAGAIESVDATAQVFETPTAVRNANGTTTVTVVLSAYNGDVGVIYEGGAAPVTNIVATAAAPGTFTDTPANLAADATYAFSAYGKNANGTEVVKEGGVFYNGDLSVATVSDANESGLVPGVFRITRGDSAHDLPVTYTVGGTAVADQSYVALSGTATIPAGATYVDVTVTPLNDPTVTEDVTVSVSLDAGLYGVSASAGTATMTISNLNAPAGFNTWVASAAGQASVSNNWSAGHPPTASEHVLFDGRFSLVDCTWDAAASATVASWTQTNDYTGVITLKTVYPGKGDFQCLTVTGPMAIHSGTITHPQSRTQGQSATDYLQDLLDNETYRVRIDAGSLAVGANGRIDARNKGYYHSNSGNHTSPLPSHGGWFGASGQAPYDDVKEPVHIGMPYKRASGGYYIGIGGGAIYLTSAGAIVVDGFIGADTGSDTWNRGLTLRNGAAAGSVYVRGASVTGTGTISASAVSTSDQNNRGVGGRVAVISTSSTPVDYTTLQLKATVYPFKNDNGQSTTYGSCGTVFIKDATQAYGTLLLQNVDGIFAPTIERCTPVITEGDWTFDAIGLGNRAVLSVPVGTALHLPGGLDSVFSLSAAGSTAYGSIRYEGGTLDFGSAANQTMSGNWMLTPWTNLTLNANVIVKDEAAIGVPAMASIKDADANADPAARKLPAFVSSHVTIAGDLTVETNGQLRAVSCGFVKRDHNNPSPYLGVLGYGTHGGRHRAKGKGDYLCPTNFFYKGYDSVFSPALPGCSGWWGNGSSESGGALSLVVTGHLALDGPANAYGAPATGRADQNNAGGAGGSIDITAGTISGSGSINANGGSISSTQGGGGRIAIKLTAPGADFSHFAVSNVFASGRTYGNTANEKTTSSAGTVYLQSAAQGNKGGTVHVAMAPGNRLAGNTNTTEMVSLGYGGDAVEDYKRVSYVVRDFGHAAVNTNFQAEAVTISDADSSIDLEGHELVVREFFYPDADSGNRRHLSPGVYDWSALADYAWATDSSADKTGRIVVRGAATVIIVK